MKFEWDEAKNRANIHKHGFDFADAQEVFRGLIIADLDDREDYEEIRWVGLGLIRGRIVHIVFTERNPETIRVISLRKATRREKAQFQKIIKDKLEAH